MTDWDKRNQSQQNTSRDDQVHIDQETELDPVSQSNPSGQPELKTDDQAWKIGEIILDEFEVISHLGKGGAGSVYLVKRLSFDDLFAAKVPVRSIADSVRLRKLFYREIRTWLGLPEHTHLSTCRFIRTIGPKIVVFSEYVAGGSLNEWIKEKKITRLETALDIAIQIAWGLHAAHANKVIHQDIKPSNILVSNEGLVKITDFGLSRAYQAIDDDLDDSEAFHPETKILKVDQASVSTGIMTPMFCSPEQSERLPLDFRTDIWSYGLTVLSMFTGPSRWISGVMAESILDGILIKGPYSPYPELTPEIIDLLRGCFRKNPVDRWPSMREIADGLISVYKLHTGVDYPRKMPETKIQSGFKGSFVTDSDIRKAYKLLEKDMGELDLMEANSVKSRKTWVLYQIELIHDTVLELKNSQRIDTGKSRGLIFNLLLNRIILHREIADFDGAYEILNQLLDMTRDTPFEQMPHTDKNQLARINYQFGYTHLMKSEFSQAVSYFTRAEEIWIPLAEEHDLDSYWDNAINAMNSCAVALHSMNEIQRPLELQNRCIEIFNRLINEKGRDDLRAKAAGNMTNKALLLSETGKTDEAIALHKQGIEIREKLWAETVDEDLTKEVIYSLPTGYINLACDLYALKDYDQAIEYNVKAIDLMEDLVFNRGVDDLRLFLARTYMNKGNTETAKHLLDDALVSFDKSIKLINQMLYNEGNSSLVPELVYVYGNKASTLVEKQQYIEAQTMVRKSLELVSEYYKNSDTSKYVVLVTRIYNNLFVIYEKAGQNDRAADALIEAVNLFKNFSGKTDLSSYYYEYLQPLIWNYFKYLSELHDTKMIDSEADCFNQLFDGYTVTVDESEIKTLKLGIRFYQLGCAVNHTRSDDLKTQLEEIRQIMALHAGSKPDHPLRTLISTADQFLSQW